MKCHFAVPVIAGCLAVACSGSGASGAPEPVRVLTTDLLDAQSRVVAHARVTPRGADSVAVVIDATDALPAGAHGVHFHAIGKCVPPTFGSAGPHLNPRARKHGLQNPDGAHAGDMPNLEGKHFSILAAASMQALTGPDGSAIVIHADRDDHITDPSGNSGARIACGVLQPVEAKPATP